MIEKFNINNVIEHYKLDVEILAKVLFPSVKYPKQAFDRVLKEETVLSTSQLESLASYLGVTISDLYSPGSWKDAIENGYLTFTKDEYKAKLNYNNVFLSIYKNNDLIHSVIGNIPNMTIGEFINYINNQIKNYENGNNQSCS